MGVPSGVPSGKVHRWNAPGVECRTSSGSGPARLEENGTLNDKLTVESPGADGVIGGGPGGRLKTCEAMSWCGRDMPKVGVILSHPWRAWPVKLVILCIVGPGESKLGGVLGEGSIGAKRYRGRQRQTRRQDRAGRVEERSLGLANGNNREYQKLN